MAIERGDGWVQDFGDAPSTGEPYERWVPEIATVAAGLLTAEALPTLAPSSAMQR
jgi:hypothetical protein